MKKIDLREINLSKADLHLHTRFSDGELEPEELVQKCVKDGLECISITDHDGIDGSMLCFAQNLDEKYGIRIIPGIEFDSQDALGKNLHILGYNIDFESDVMKETIGKLVCWRKNRNSEMLSALQGLGYSITQEELDAVNKGRYIGKPTFTKVFSDKGLISNDVDMYDVIYKKPELKKIRKETLSSKDVVEIIHMSGGVAVLAHPMEQLNIEEEKTFEVFKPRLNELLDQMLSYGIDGIECWHPSASEKHSKYLEKYADEHKLIKTKGSDFHKEGNQREYTRYHV